MPKLVRTSDCIHLGQFSRAFGIRDSEFEKIKNSIEQFGYVDPIIVNKDMTVIGGHQRITVLKTLGYTEIDCVVIDIDKTKEKALNVALNKISGEWNKELLADLIQDLQSLDYDIVFTEPGSLMARGVTYAAKSMIL